MNEQQQSIKPKEVNEMKTKASKNQHKQNNSKDNQKQKARYVMLDEGSDRFFYGACPECGKEGQLKNTNALLWSYCEMDKTAWIIWEQESDHQGLISSEFNQSIEDAGLKRVSAINTTLETPENKAAMLEEMGAKSITSTSEIHLVDQVVKFKECFGLHPLPDGCAVQVRFRWHLSNLEQIKQLELVKDKIAEIIVLDENPYI